MNTIIINETTLVKENTSFVFDLTQANIKRCVKCWSCWFKTSGCCVQNDLHNLYGLFFQADKVVFLLQPSLDFVSENVKHLFECMIVSALPYIDYTTINSMHGNLYPINPLIEVYYEDTFSSQARKELFEEYIDYVFCQFGCTINCIQTIDCYQKANR